MPMFYSSNPPTPTPPTPVDQVWSDLARAVWAEYINREPHHTFCSYPGPVAFGGRRHRHYCRRVGDHHGVHVYFEGTPGGPVVTAAWVESQS